MDSLILIIQYIFNKKDINIDIESIEYFFEDGLLFPLFISTIFNLNDIPGMNYDPETASDKQQNNENALQLLFQNNKSIQKEHPNIKTIDDQKNLLKLIFTKQYFKLDQQQIIDQCNLIVEPFGMHFNSETDLIKIQNLLTILQSLSIEKVQNIPEEISNDLLTRSFEDAKVPIILDINSLDKRENQKNLQLSSQSSNIKLTEDDTQSSQIFESSEISEDIENSEVSVKKKRSSSFFRFRRKRDNSSDSEESAEYYSDEEDEKENEDLQNEALLKTLNAIGAKGGFHFNDFEEAVKNDSIPKFVMYFFNIDTIEKVRIEGEVKSRIGTEHLTDQELSNINAVIEFIKTKQDKFKVLYFDFQDLMNIEASTILFYTNFLNCFFLKKLKQEMYQRTVRLLCTHTARFNDKYNNLLFTKYKIYPCLLHFISKGNLHFTFNYHKAKFDDSSVERYFKDVNIPMIVNKELLRFAKKYVSFPIFYQLQFIFDALDSAPPSRRIVELIMNSLFEIKKLDVPKFVEIASSIKVKRQSLKLQNKIGTRYRNMNISEEEIKKYSKKERNEIEKPRTFSELCDKDPNYLNNLKGLMKPPNHSEKTECLPFLDYWNSPDLDYKYDSGIVYNEKKSSVNKTQSQTDWINEIANIQKNIKKRERKTLITNKGSDMTVKFNQRRNNIESKLYKIFVCDETENKWIFNSENIEQFSKSKAINFNDLKTPLILYLNSNEKDLITMNSNLLNSNYPKLDDDDDIFIYALCDRSLTMLNYFVDFKNAEKSSIKPIFLLLHVPKEKENHPKIRLIVSQIYSFLSTICVLEIVLLNKEHYLDQIEFIKEILMLNKVYDDANTYEKLPFSFSYQQPISTSNYYFTFENSNEESNLIYKEPKFVVLVNEQTVQFRNEVDENLNNNEFFINLFSQFDKEMHLHFINVEDCDTYENFLNCMNDIIMKNSCCLFNEIETNFNVVSNCYFTDKYLQIMIKDDYYDLLEKEIIERLHMLSIEEDKNSKVFFSNLSKKFQLEVEKIAPKNNKDFANKCYNIRKLFDHEDCCNENVRKLLKENIQNLANSHLNYLNQYINQKYYWKIQQMADMIKSHKKFLRNELFSIIQNLFKDDLIESAFEFNFDIIEIQIEKDRKKIMQIFQPFIDKIDIKGQTKVRDLRNTMKKGTNYTMKETENLREIKVAVQVNQDLKSVIEQDF